MKKIKRILKAPKIRALYFIINTLHSIALKNGITEKEYIYSLVIYSLSAIKFDSFLNKNYLKSAPIPVLMAYISGVLHYEKVINYTLRVTSD